MAALTTFAAQPIVNARTKEGSVLGALWSRSSSPVILVFLRRLGCALCRTTCAEYSDALPQLTAAGATVVCLSFEALGEGSDSDRSFEAGKYWTGPLYTISKDVYSALFGRKGMFNGFFGLADMSQSKLAACTDRKIGGNISGDGFLLGGQFIITPGGTVTLDKRQQFFGDDSSVEELLEGVAEAVELHRVAAAAGAAAAGGGGVQEWGGGKK
jgi:hypothetical protein